MLVENKKYLEFRISIFYCAYILAYLTFFVNIFTKNLWHKKCKIYSL
nr:MAG TPA: hypothetical protein [Caudoviricetes sp.]